MDCLALELTATDALWFCDCKWGVESSWETVPRPNMSVLKYMVLLNRDVPRAAQFYAHGLGLAVNVCTTRWAELQSGPCKIALMESPSNVELTKGYSPFLSFNVKDMDSTVLRLLSMGAELDGPIKYPPQGKVAALRCLDGHMLGLFEPNKPE
ncbi:uncharacterized protein [Physcomitrium patens]